MSFEGANYTVITSRCKGPLYQQTLCCGALKDFACPYSTYINDASTNCAATMFSYINLYGKLLTTFLADELIQEFQSRDEEEQQEVLKKREELGKQVEFW